MQGTYYFSSTDSDIERFIVWQSFNIPQHNRGYIDVSIDYEQWLQITKYHGRIMQYILLHHLYSNESE